MVERSKLMCSPHWRMVPLDLQRQVYRAYRYGQGMGSEEHARACDEAITAVNLKLGFADG